MIAIPIWLLGHRLPIAMHPVPGRPMQAPAQSRACVRATTPSAIPANLLSGRISRPSTALASGLLGGNLLLPTVRVLVVDDYAPWMHFITVALALKPEIKVVGEAQDGLTAIQKVVELKPDLVVLDIGLPDMSGIQVARRILELAPTVRILFLTENTTPEVVRAALLTGAQGYVVKSFAARELLPALEALLLDCYFVSAAAAIPKVEDGASFRRLSDA